MIIVILFMVISEMTNKTRIYIFEFLKNKETSIYLFRDRSRFRLTFDGGIFRVVGASYVGIGKYYDNSITIPFISGFSYQFRRINA